jgi:hypothetical protein
MRAISLDNSQRYWLRYLSLWVVTVLIAGGVALVGGRLRWPQPQSIAVAVFFFLFFSLTPDRAGRPHRGWVSRVVYGIVAAGTVLLVHAVLANF